jgi:hypothetical protein
VKKKLFAGAALLLYAVFQAAAAAPELSIRFYNKKIYYTDGDPVYIQITLSNSTPDVYRFRLADDRVFSVDFDVRTIRNRAVEPSDVLLWRRGASAQIFFREVVIEPGESFSFVEDLRDYARLDQPGNYVVQARLYPELLKKTGTNILQIGADERYQNYQPRGNNGSDPVALVSPRLNLSLRSPLYAPDDGIPQALDVETNAVLVREKLPPDEVVRFMLTARQKSQWEKFFLYLDLEEMVRRDAARERQWRAESEEGRRRILERFRTDLQSAVIDGDISAIPVRFEIERTAYNANEGSVVVLERFKQGDYTEKRRYTYQLRRIDDIWTVVDYVVVNLGTE